MKTRHKAATIFLALFCLGYLCISLMERAKEPVGNFIPPLTAIGEVQEIRERSFAMAVDMEARETCAWELEGVVSQDGLLWLDVEDDEIALEKLPNLSPGDSVYVYIEDPTSAAEKDDSRRFLCTHLELR